MNDSDYDIEKELNKTVYLNNIYIYSWGRNNHGELGLGNTESTISTPTGISSLSSLDIKSIAAGGKHTLVLSEDKQLYTCGSDLLGILGLDKFSWKNIPKFQKIETKENTKFIKIVCGEFHSLALSEEGTIFAWGGNWHNKLGNDTLVNIPGLISSLNKKKIIDIAVGEFHSIALSNTGSVYSWGGGGVSYNKGQCGHGDLIDRDTPTKIDFFKNKSITKISCGGYHTIIVTNENINELSNTKTNNTKSKFDDNNTTFKIKETNKLNNSVDLLKSTIKSNLNTSNYISNNEDKIEINNELFQVLYGFGNSEYGQCGYGYNIDTSIPKKIIIPINKETEKTYIIKKVSCGGYHSVLLTNTGNVLVFGHGFSGQLGISVNKNILKPILVSSLKNKHVVDIAAGWNHTLILTEKNYLYACGYNKYGQLGLGDYRGRKNFINIREASKLNIMKIFAGGHHSYIILDKKEPVKSNYEDPSPLDPSTPNDISVNNSFLNTQGNYLNSQTQGNIISSSNYNNLFVNNTDQNIVGIKTRSLSNNNTIEILKAKNTILLPKNNEANSKHLSKSMNKFANKSSILDEDNYKNLSIQILKEINQQIEDKDPIILELIYSHVKISHRYIRFKIKESYLDSLFKLIDNCYNQDDKRILNVNLTSDSEIEVVDNEINRSNKNCSFSLCYLYNLSEDDNLNNNYVDLKQQILDQSNNIINNDTDLEKIKYDYCEIRESNLRKNEIEYYLSSWTLDFKNKFEFLFSEEPKFMEIRPQMFKDI